MLIYDIRLVEDPSKPIKVVENAHVLPRVGETIRIFRNPTAQKYIDPMSDKHDDYVVDQVVHCIAFRTSVPDIVIVHKV